jgi:hypothetical protein
MAVKWAIANGNWSATASWNSFTLPVQGDEVYADGKTITIDQNIDVLRLTTAPRTGGIPGGAFNITTSGLTITASIISAGTTNCLVSTLSAGQTLNINSSTISTGTYSTYAYISYANGATVNLTGTISFGVRPSTITTVAYGAYFGTGTYNMNGNILGASSGNNSYALYLVSSTLNLTGNVVAGNGSSTNGIYVINNSTINATGSVWGGNSSSMGIYTYQNIGNIRITGDVYGGINTTAYGIYILTGGNLQVTGNLIGRSGASAYPVLLSAATMSLTGNVSAGSAANCWGIYVLNSDVTVVGNVSGGTGSDAFGIYNLNSSSFVVTGTVSAGSGGQGIRHNGSKTSTINGQIFASSAKQGIYYDGSGSLIINGTQSCNGTETTKITKFSTGGNLTINGNIIGATQGTLSSVLVDDGITTTTINGNITQQNIPYTSTSTGGLVYILRSGTFNVNGNVTGGSANNTAAIRVLPLTLATPVRINILGNISNGVSPGSAAIDLASQTSYNGYCIMVATGSVTGGSQFPAISTARFLDSITIAGNITNTSGVMAIYAYKLNISNSAVQNWTLQTTSGSNRAISTSNASNGAPLAKDVRLGLTYGTVGELTGTLAVPTYSRVSVGVAVDDSVGTAVLNVADVGALLAGYVV